jgi:hypothetical protein
MNDIVKSTRRFEAWLRQRLPVVEADLAYKHDQMRANAFMFFRATFYRWVQVWPVCCPKLARALPVWAVGDLHLENFGTWRDAEGRLVWGVNDFDEAHPMAFPNDLVRVAVSALLALRLQPAMKLDAAAIFDQLRRGYQGALAAGGRPFVLEEDHPLLRAMATQQLRQPVEFWQRLDAKTRKAPRDLPDGVGRAFRKLLPDGAIPAYRTEITPKGLGSLGRRRFLAVTTWEGGRLAREAKDVVPSACLWAAKERPGKGNPWLERTVAAAVRCADPFYTVKGRWLVRRLGPECGRIDLDELTHHQDLASLLHAMGWETANIHLGTPKLGRKLTKACAKLPSDWLETAARTMLDRTLKDWEQFRETKESALRD